VLRGGLEARVAHLFSAGESPMVGMIGAFLREFLTIFVVGTLVAEERGRVAPPPQPLRCWTAEPADPAEPAEPRKELPKEGLTDWSLRSLESRLEIDARREVVGCMKFLEVFVGVDELELAVAVGDGRAFGADFARFMLRRPGGGGRVLMTGGAIPPMCEPRRLL